MSPKIPRALVLPSVTVCQETHCGKLFVTVTYDQTTKTPLEVFTQFGKSGGCGSAVMSGLATIISYGLRSGTEVKDVIKGLSGIGCHHGQQTCMNAVAEAFQHFTEELEAN